MRTLSILIRGEMIDSSMNPKETVTTFLGDNWADQILPLLEESIRLCLAAAYMDLQGVRLLKSILKESSPAQSRSFNFLLDKDFHANEYARQVIINELLEIPQAEVRIHDGPDRFLHSKVFIFHTGNLAYVLVGSMNPTGAGFKRNIEAGIKTTDPEVHREAQAFFNDHWSTARKARFVAGADYERQIFRAGERVLHTASGRVGLISSEVPPRREHHTWVYPVIFQVERPADWINEGDLSPFEVTIISARFPDRSTISSVNDLRKRFLRAKLAEASELNLFSYQSSRTDRLAYQFKPLLRILSAQRPRILVADEVGLGKTIEAGIIIQEFRARLPSLKRILVVVPNNLQEKWGNELAVRFDSYYDRLAKRSFLTWIDNYRQKRGDVPLAAIASFDLVRNRDVAEAIRRAELSLDVLVVDEAHHLRNQGTQIHEIMRDLCRWAKIIVFLTATPVNLGNQDLFHLMQLLVPEEFAEMNFTTWQDFLNPNRYFMECVRMLQRGAPELVHPTLNREIVANPAYGPRYRDNPDFDHVLRESERWKQFGPVESLSLQNNLLRLNPLQRYINRTRKVDVQVVIDRAVSADFFSYSKEEKLQYETILERCRASYKSTHRKRSAFFFIMPERQAASCLPVAWRKYGVESQIAVRDEDPSVVFESAETDEDDLEAFSRPLTRPEQFEEAQDTKFDRLTEYVSEVRKVDGAGEKFVIFSFFLDTVDYLVSRLNRVFGAGSAGALSGRTADLGERERILKAWEDDSGPSILICSEIGSEGLDLQRNCKRLVNYDLPWNPMRLEQRIGRIDRYGQASPKIFIWNPIAAGTIDEPIFRRLQSRIKVAENTLGPVAEVLGSWEKEFTEILLRSKPTEEELDRRLHEQEVRLREAETEEAKLAKTELGLSGLDDFFVHEISGVEQGRKFFTPDEVRLIVDIFNQEAPGRSTLEPVGAGTFGWKISDDAAQILIQSVERDSRIHEEKKRNHYTAILSRRQTLRVTFDQNVAKDELRTVFLTIHNPLITAILRLWQPRESEMLEGVLTVRSRRFVPGKYLWIAYYIRYWSPSTRPSVFLVHQVLNLTDMTIISEEDARVFADDILVSGENVVLDSIPTTNHDDRAVGVLNANLEEILRHLKEDREVRTGSVRAARVDGIDRTYGQQISMLESDLDQSIDPLETQRLKDEIARLRVEWQQERRKLLTLSKYSTSAYPILTILASVTG